MCRCPAGLALKNEFQCVNKSVVCPGRQFVCSNGRCLMDGLVCDKQNDCGDSSDELPALCGEYSTVLLVSFLERLFLSLQAPEIKRLDLSISITKSIAFYSVMHTAVSRNAVQLKSIKAYATIPKGMMGYSCSLLHRQVHEFSARWKAGL